jgi:Flp pilus assembly protein TadD
MKTEQILTGEEALALAAKLEAEGRPADAEKVLRAIIKADPKNAKAYNRLGGLLFGQDKFQALYLFERALKADRRYVAALSNRGTLLGELGHYDESEADLRLSTHLQPDNPIAWNSLGNTLMRVGRHDAALTAIDRALALVPENAVAHFNRGCTLNKLGRHHEAIASFDATLSRDPDFRDARYNRAISKLHLGHPDAWDEYEARFASSERIYRMPSTAPRWNGESLAGKTILLWGEQGHGDSIMFMRYVERVLDKGPARILLYVHTALRALCAGAFEGVELLTSDTDLPAHDVHSPLMSLPRFFGIIPHWEPREQMFHCPDCDRWGKLIGDSLHNPATRVGIAWAGNPGQANDANRSMPIAAFGPLWRTPGVKFFSLQKDVPDRDRIEFDALVKAGHLTDLSDKLTDMRQTAHAIGWLDIVITVDTSVAHLAASLGAHTWIMLCHQPCWRWGDTTPWYPDALLIRQPRKGDWASVVRSIQSRIATSLPKVA